VEERTVHNRSGHPHHSFHLHTNHFLATSVNGAPLDPPVRHDTVGIPRGGHVVLRGRFEEFTGRTVLHRHQLQHGDEGMMQVVECRSSHTPRDPRPARLAGNAPGPGAPPAVRKAGPGRACAVAGPSPSPRHRTFTR
jgi:hypothetical protein